MVSATNANGGVAITASHNPSEWNALKFIGGDGLLLSHVEATELLDIYNQPEREYVGEEDYRSAQSIDNAFDTHREKIFSQMDIDAVRGKRYKVAIDCCNGTGSFHSKAFLEELGCEVVSIFDSPDRGFQRKPEPTAENITALCEAVARQRMRRRLRPRPRRRPPGDRRQLRAPNRRAELRGAGRRAHTH